MSLTLLECLKLLSRPLHPLLGPVAGSFLSTPRYPKDDDNLYKYDDFGFIGFDLWQARSVASPTDHKWSANMFSRKIASTAQGASMHSLFCHDQVKGNTIFDNVIITDDVSEADKFVEKWKALSEVEKAKKKEETWNQIGGMLGPDAL